MKAHVQLIGDYDEQTETYGIQLIAYEKDVNESGIKDGDLVEVTPATKKDTLSDSDRQYQLRETLRMWDLFEATAPMANQVKHSCRSLIACLRAELASRDAVAKCQRKGADE